MKSGIFITIEGPDGCGKTTQIDLLKSYLKECGIQYVITREPGGTEISEKIRDLLLDKDNSEMDPVTETLLYAAARAQHVKQTIIPALEEFKVVICDRFIDSNVVYQGLGRGLGVDAILDINNFSLSTCRYPDLTILLKLDFGSGLSRKSDQTSGNLDRMESAGEEFHATVQSGYNILEDLFPDRIKPVCASNTIEEVHNEIKGIVDDLINSGEYMISLSK